ncbi:MAG TPA: hypothetical protein VN442_18515 [Bryobacteraceae bacterium]|nr:hypothetical protein [Bryobacteraceae bacterium]
MFAQRPSDLLGIEDAVVALNVDMAACLAVQREEVRLMEESREDGVRHVDM